MTTKPTNSRPAITSDSKNRKFPLISYWTSTNIIRGAAEITSHPRIIPSLVRRPDDARKLKRAARAERKAQADLAREEEARKTKGKKRREMDIQLAALRKEVGEKEWKKVEEVLEGEYDEALWERVVGGLLSGQMDDGGDDDDVSFCLGYKVNFKLMGRMRNLLGRMTMRICNMARKGKRKREK